MGRVQSSEARWMTSGFRFAPNAPHDQHHTSHHGQYKKKSKKRFWEAYIVDSAIDKFTADIPRVVLHAERHIYLPLC
jgi:hypothetical protein